MTYKIKAPHAGYDRKLMGVQFTGGEAVTDDAWAVSWFSGREGFTVEVEKRARKKVENEGEAN